MEGNLVLKTNNDKKAYSNRMNEKELEGLKGFVEKIRDVLKEKRMDGLVDLDGHLSSGFSNELLASHSFKEMIDSFIKLLEMCVAFQHVRARLLDYHALSINFGNFSCFIANKAMKIAIIGNGQLVEKIQREMGKIYKLIDEVRVSAKQIKIKSVSAERESNLARAYQETLNVERNTKELKLQMEGIDETLNLWESFTPEDVQKKLEGQVKDIDDGLAKLQKINEHYGLGLSLAMDFKTTKHIRILVQNNPKPKIVIAHNKAEPLVKLPQSKSDMIIYRQSIVDYLRAIITQSPLLDLQILAMSLTDCRLAKARKKQTQELKLTQQEDFAMKIYHDYFIPLREAAKQIHSYEATLEPENRVFHKFIDDNFIDRFKKEKATIQLSHAEYIVCACGAPSQIKELGSRWRAHMFPATDAKTLPTKPTLSANSDVAPSP